MNSVDLPSSSPTGRLGRIQRLNDQLRAKHLGGAVVLSAGVAALDEIEIAAVLTAVAGFEAFDEANDPYGEHDFGRLEVGDHVVMFKIDYFDRSLRLHSPDPADPKVTARVMTVMLAEDY